MNCTHKMASVRELHIAIQKCQCALVKKLINELRSQNIDLSSELAFAKQLAQVKGGPYNMLVSVF